MTDSEIKHPDFAKRLTALMDNKGLDRNALSAKTKISYEMIRRYSEGIAKPRTNKLKMISDALGTSAAYLDYGEAPKAKPSLDNLREKMKVMESEQDDLVTDGDVPVDTKRISLVDTVGDRVPVISWVAAGSFTDVMPVTIDDVVDWIPRPQHLSSRAFGLIIQGRSMWPEFKPDEIIYVEPEITPWSLKDGDLIVIHCNDDKQATFKQLVIGDSIDDMYLKPLNPDWPDQKMVPMGECSLVGIVDSKYTRYRH